MSDFAKIIIAATLGYVGSVISVLIGYLLTTAYENRKARREHKTRIRLLRASFPVTSSASPCSVLDDWWLHAIDDCSWLRRRKIKQCIREFRHVKFPVPDWDINDESEYTAERTNRYRQQLDQANLQAAATIDAIINTI
jgi:hypothetical protein